MALKGRPKKVRYMQKMPKIIQFSPRGRPGRPDEVELMFDHYEAMKLADFQGFNQEQGALAMRLSRASFGRIVREARRRVADALVNGKTIKIRMGNVQVGVRRLDFTLKGELERFHARSSRMIRDIGEMVAKDARARSSGDGKTRRSGKREIKAEKKDMVKDQAVQT